MKPFLGGLLIAVLLSGGTAVLMTLVQLDSAQVHSTDNVRL